MNHIGSRSINCFSLVYYTHHQTKINYKVQALAYTDHCLRLSTCHVGNPKSYAVFKNAAMTRKWDYTAGARTCAVGMGGN